MAAKKTTPSGSTAASDGATPKKLKKQKKRRWYHNIADAYKITTQIIPNTKLHVWGAVVAVLVIFIVLTIVTGRYIFFPLMGIVTSLTVGLVVLSLKANKARYKQIDGQLGAVGALLNEGRRGWSTQSEPAAINARTRDLVYRIVGRPGVVLISEGPPNRVTRMLEDEKRKVARIMPEVPVHPVQIGNDKGQVHISKMWKAVGAPKNKLTPAEIAVVAKRLDSISSASRNLPIPKGIDPMRARPNRRALRGR